MKKTGRIVLGSILVAAAVAWTLIIALVDRAAIGPLGSVVGLSHINSWFLGLTGFNSAIYKITDILTFVPFAIAGAFAVLGLVQWIKRKSILKVEREIVTLGIFYVVVISLFVIFEYFIKINFRPIIEDGALEASYPSSHTMVCIFVCISAPMALKSLYSGQKWVRPVNLGLLLLMALIVVGRLVSGAHWLTDIIGGLLISSALLVLFSAFYKTQKSETKNQLE